MDYRPWKCTDYAELETYDSDPSADSPEEFEPQKKCDWNEVTNEADDCVDPWEWDPANVVSLFSLVGL